MFTLPSHRLPRVFVGLVALMGLALVAGCSDVITYSRDSREKGIKLYNDGSYAEAAGAFRNSLRQEPGDYRSHYYLALCYEKQGSWGLAIQQYKTTLGVMQSSLEGKEDKPLRLATLDGLARSIARSGDRNAQTAALASGPKTAEDQFLLAKVSRNVGDADAAVEAYNQAALMDPKEFAIAKEFGLYLLQLGQNQQADPQLRRAYALNDKDSEVTAGLRQIGVVPGPSLKEANDLEKPVVPVGPIPEVNIDKINPFRSAGSSGPSTPTADSGPKD